MTPQQQELARNLFEIGAIQFGAFRLALHEKQPDAPLSPIYIDLRAVRSFPEVVIQAVQAYESLILPLQFDVLADVPTAATPFVAILAYKLHIPMVTPRGLKTHGSGASIDGAWKAGTVALLIDDLITGADSKMAAIKTLEAGGLQVQDVLVLIDRQQGGEDVLRKAGYHLHSAFTISDLLAFYRDNELITQERYAETMAYLDLQ